LWTKSYALRIGEESLSFTFGRHKTRAVCAAFGNGRSDQLNIVFFSVEHRGLLCYNNGGTIASVVYGKGLEAYYIL
jgi:hypothetical protein